MCLFTTSNAIVFRPRTGNKKESLKFWNLHVQKNKTKKKNNRKKQKQKRKIYIFNRVPPEKVDTFCAIKSELDFTTPSLNYTHLQNLTRSLAKKM